jgi:hypothetical protein
MEDPPRVELTLDPNGVANAAQWIASMASEVVGTCLRALENDNHARPDLTTPGVIYRFGDLGLDLTERRLAFRNWVLCNGFKDLIRGVRACLEEAILFIEFARTPPSTTTLDAVREKKLKTLERAQRMNFPTLLATVNKSLKEPLSFDDEFSSLQSARNCLEHRHGIVSDVDIDKLTGKLSIKYSKMRAFLKYGDLEVEMQVGKTMQEHFQGIEIEGDTEIPLLIQRVTKEINFERGQQMTFSDSEFYEIALACFFFASDLATKLPDVGTNQREA